LQTLPQKQTSTGVCWQQYGRRFAIHYFCPNVTKLGAYGQIFVKFPPPPKKKFKKNNFRGVLPETAGRPERRKKAIRRFF